MAIEEYNYKRITRLIRCFCRVQTESSQAKLQHLGTGICLSHLEVKMCLGPETGCGGPKQGTPPSNSQPQGLSGAHTDGPAPRSSLPALTVASQVKMRGLALVLLQVFSLLAPALGLLGPSPFSRNALAFGVVPDVNVFKGALSADSPSVRLNSDLYLQPNKTLLLRGTGQSKEDVWQPHSISRS